MSQSQPTSPAPSRSGKLLRTFPRFSRSQRWEHSLLILSVLVLLLTGLPQKYRTAEWSHQILSTPERLATIQDIHHIAALVLAMEVIYHLGIVVVQMVRRQLPGDMLPTWQDVKDAWQMLLHLLFIRKEKPAFGKYNFEQKITYWFVFFGIAILGVSGFIIWFPELFTRFLPGGVVPAAKLAHSTEAISLAIFVIIWHFYHVHIERLNLSVFTGYITDEDMQTYHQLEYERLTSPTGQESEAGEDVS